MYFPQAFAFLLLFDPLRLGLLALLFQLGLYLLSFDHFASEVGQLDLEALAHPLLGIGITSDYKVKVFLCHCAFELSVVPIIGEVSTHLSLEKEHRALFLFIAFHRKELPQFVALPEVLDAADAAYDPFVPVPEELHADPPLKTVSCGCLTRLVLTVVYFLDGAPLS